MERYTNTILNKQGKPVAGAVVVVTTYPGNEPAVIYAADGGQQVQTVSSDDNGRFAFYAADGHYNLSITGKQIDAITITDVVLNDPNDDGGRDAYEAPDAAALAAAVSANPGRVIQILAPDNDVAVPADYSMSMLEYTGLHPLRFTHTPSPTGKAKRTFKTQFPAAHSTQVYSAVHVETQAIGSGKNGPDSSDNGITIAIHKKGYSGATDPVGGEIDGLSIFVRQDGPKGQASGSASSSDATGVLVNIQNVEDAGFTSAWEATTSNYNRTSNSIPYSIQTQIGVLDMNKSGTPTYGYVAIASRGGNGAAFYAANGSNGGTWTNVLFAPGMARIDSAGNHYAYSPEWVNGAWTITRAAGANGTTEFLHRGTGALFLNAQEGAVQFGTGGAIRWEVSSTGTLRPSSTNTTGAVGDPNRRVTPYAQKLDLSAAGVSGLVILSGAGAPAVVANVGSLYLRSDGGAGTTLYVKESGTGTTGWVAK